MGIHRRGFTFIDLIVAITLAVCLIPVAADVVMRSQETSTRVKCASNLKQIGQAILLYGNEDGNAYPRTRYRAETADAPTAWSGANSTTPFTPDGPAVNDVTSAYRLLVPTQELSPDVFICPSSPVGDVEFARARFEPKHANFLDERELNYSFANPYPTAAVRDAGFTLTTYLSADFAVAADINPGIYPPDNDVTAVASTDSARNTKPGNSPNHDRDGQNILYGDGHVEFTQTPFAGVTRDNIYTFGRREQPAAGFGIVGAPTHKDDSVLLPTLDPALWRTRHIETQTTSVVWIVFPTLVALAILVAIYRVVHFNSHRGRNAPTSA